MFRVYDRNFFFVLKRAGEFFHRKVTKPSKKALGVKKNLKIEGKKRNKMYAAVFITRSSTTTTNNILLFGDTHVP